MRNRNGFTRVLVSPEHHQNCNLMQIQRRCVLRPRRGAVIVCRVALGTLGGPDPEMLKSAMSNRKSMQQS
jgi:hypothetical protein